MAAPSLTYTLTNGQTADADQVMQNFNDLLNGYTDGTKDLSISALTCAGTSTFNGAVNLGNASGDDLTFTGSLASTIPIKTTATYNIGSSTLGLAGIYFGANSQTVRVIGSGSMSATWTLTLPVTAGTDKYFLMTNGSGVATWSQIVNASVADVAATKVTGRTDAAAASAGYIGEVIAGDAIAATTAVGTTTTAISSITLSAGAWALKYNVMANYNTGATASDRGYVYCRIRDSGDSTTTSGSVKLLFCKTVAAVGNIAEAPISAEVFVNVSGSTTYLLRALRVDTAGTGSATIINNDTTESSKFYAVRIA